MLSNLVLANDAFTVTNQGTGQALDVLANDVDTQGGVVHISGVASAAHGAVVITPGVGGTHDKITYTPVTGYAGSDSFTYTAQGVDLKTATASVSLTIVSGASGSSSGVAPSLVNFRLTNMTGAAGSNSTTDAHVAGTLVATGSTSGLSVQFDFNGDNVVDATATQVNADGTFNFDVAHPGTGITGIPYGAVTLRARGVQSVNGQTLTGAWQTLAFTYLAPAPTTPVVSGVHLVNDTGIANDLVTSDARITGAISYSGSVSGLTVQIDSNSDGVSDLTATTAADGSFQINVAQQNGSGPGVLYGKANLQIRAGSNGVYGAWQSFSFTYEPAPVAPSIKTLALVNDTGTASDGTTTDPRITGQFAGGTGSVANLTVQIDYNGDGVFEATATTDSTGSFTFDPRLSYGATPALAFGNRTLSVRAGMVDQYSSQLIYGTWSNISINYVQQTVASDILNLHLVNDTGLAGDNITADPTIGGSLSNTAGASGLVVQYDYNGDGVADLTATPNPDGSFNLNMGQAHGSLPAIGYGNVNLQVRAGKAQADSTNLLFGNWSSLPFVYSANPPGDPTAFYVDQLRLIYDSGTSNLPATGNPQITGYVVGAANSAKLSIEYDLNGDGVADGTTTTTAAGTFVVDLTSANLAAGNITVRIRAKQTDTNNVTIASPWSQLTFQYTPPPVSTVANLHLDNNVGTATNPIAQQALIDGTLTFNGSPQAGTAVEYAWTASDQPVDTVYTANDGTFKFDLSQDSNLKPGSVTVFFRGVMLPPGASTAVFGPWQSFQFTYSPITFTPPAITAFGLINNTATATDPSTHDPRVAGTLTNSGGPVNNLPVEFDLTGDGTVAGTVYTDTTGKFQIDPTDFNIPDGPATIRVRTYLYDADHLKYIYSDWTTAQFIYAWAAPVPPSVQNLRLVNPDGTSNNSSAVTNALVAGELTGAAAPFSHVPVQISLGNGTSIATVNTDENGKFVADVNNLLSPGTVLTAFRTSVWDKRNSVFIYSPWQSISFNYNPPVYTAPTVGQLHLTNDAETPNDGVSSDPRVSGVVALQNGAQGDVRLFYDLNRDGMPDGTATVDATSGAFTIDPRGPLLAEGPVALQVEATLQNPVTGAVLSSAWQSIAYTYQVPQVALADVTEATATTCPIGVIFAGTAPIPLNYSGNVSLEYSLHGGGKVDGSNLVTSDDHSYQFVVAQSNIPTGTTQVFVRTSTYDERKGVTVVSNWITVAITSPSVDTSALNVGQLSLVNDTGTAGDGITSDARIQGKISGSGQLGNVPIQYDLNGDGIPDGSTSTDLTGSGAFVIDLRQTGLAAGTVAISARAGRFIPGSGYSYGSWASFTFTYQPPAPVTNVTVDTLSIVAGDPSSSDAAQYGIQTDSTSLITISGHVTGSVGASGSLPVQYDLNGDGQADGETQTKSDGTFSIAVNTSIVPNGTATIGVRAGIYDNQSGDVAYGPWSSKLYQNTVNASAMGPSTTDFQNSFTQAISSNAPAAIPAPADFGKPFYSQSVLKGGVSAGDDGQFALSYGGAWGASAQAVFAQAGTIDFRTFSQLAKPFAAPSSSVHSVVPINSDQLATSTDANGINWTVETILNSTLTTDAVVSGTVWNRSVSFSSNYTIKWTDANGDTKTQSGYLNDFFQSHGDSTSAHYSDAYQSEDDFQYRITVAGGTNANGPPATTLSGAGTQGVVLSASGDKVIQPSGTFSASESFQYLAGSFAVPKPSNSSSSNAPTTQAASEVYDATATNHSAAPTLDASKHLEKTWQFQESVTIGTLSGASPVLSSLNWQLTQHTKNTSVLNLGGDQRAQTTTVDDSNTLANPTDSTKDSLTFSHKSVSLIDHSVPIAGANGSKQITTHIEDDLSNVGVQGASSGHLDFSDAVHQSTTQDSTYTASGKSLSQKQVTTLSSLISTGRDLTSSGTTGQTITSRQAVIDTGLTNQSGSNIQSLNAGVAVASPTNANQSTHTVSQYFEQTSGDANSQSPTFRSYTTVYDTACGWNNVQSASEIGTYNLDQGTLTVNNTQNFSDIGQSDVVVINNVTIGGDGSPITAGSYGQLAPNSTTISGSGGGKLSWGSQTNTIATSTSPIKPGLTITTSQTIVSLDMGSGDYSMSFSETDVNNSDGSTSSTGSFNSSSSYIGQTAYTQKSTDETTGTISNGPGNTVYLDIYNTSLITGGVRMYYGGSSGVGSIGSGGVSMSLKITDDAQDSFNFQNTTDETIDDVTLSSSGIEETKTISSSKDSGTTATTSDAVQLSTAQGSSSSSIKTIFTSSKTNGTDSSSVDSNSSANTETSNFDSWGKTARTGSSSRISNGKFNETEDFKTTISGGQTSQVGTTHSDSAGTFKSTSSGTSSEVLFEGVANDSTIKKSSGSSWSQGEGDYASSDDTVVDSSKGSLTNSKHHDDSSEEGTQGSNSTESSISSNNTGPANSANLLSKSSSTLTNSIDKGTYSSSSSDDVVTVDSAKTEEQTSNSSSQGTKSNSSTVGSASLTRMTGPGYFGENSDWSVTTTNDSGPYQTSSSDDTKIDSSGTHSKSGSSSNTTVNGVSLTNGGSHSDTRKSDNSTPNWNYQKTVADTLSTGSSNYQTTTTSVLHAVDAASSEIDTSTSVVIGSSDSSSHNLSQIGSGTNGFLGRFLSTNVDDVVGTTHTDYTTNADSNVTIDGSGTNSIDHEHTTADSTSTATDKYSNLNESSRWSRTDSAQESSIEKGIRNSSDFGHDDFTSDVANGDEKYTDSANSHGSGTSTFHREAIAIRSATDVDTPAAGLTTNSNYSGNDSVDGVITDSSQGSAVTTLKDGLTTTSSTSQSTSHEQGVTHSSSNTSGTVTGKTASKFNDQPVDVVYNDVVNNHDQSDGTYTSDSKNSGSSTQTLDSQGVPEIVAQGVAQTSYTESGTTTSHNYEKSHHDYFSGSVAGGFTENTVFSDSTGSYNSTSNESTSNNNGAVTFNDANLDAVTETTSSRSNASAQISLFGNQTSASSGSKSNSQTSSSFASTNSNSGSTDDWSSHSQGANNSWSDSTTTSSMAIIRTDRIQSNSQSSYTSDDSGSDAMAQGALTAYNDVSSSETNTTETDTSNTRSQTADAMNLSSGPNQNFSSDYATSTGTSFDDEVVNEIDSFDSSLNQVVPSGKIVDTIQINSAGTSGFLSETGETQVLNPGDMSNIELAFAMFSPASYLASSMISTPAGSRTTKEITGKSAINSLSAGGTLTTTINADGSASTNGSINISNAHNETTTWGSIYNSKTLLDQADANFASYTDVDEVKRLDYQQADTTGAITVANNQVTDGTQKKEISTSGMEDIDSRKAVSDITTTRSDNSVDHATSRKSTTDTQGITYQNLAWTDLALTGVIGAVGNLLVNSTYYEGVVTTLHSTDDQSLAGPGGYTSDNVTNSNSNEFHKAEFLPAGAVNRLDSSYNHGEQTTNTTGSLGNGTSYFNFTNSWRLDSTGGKQTLTSWSDNWGNANSTLGNTATTFSTNGHTEASGSVGTGLNGLPYLIDLKSKQWNDTESTVTTYSSGSGGSVLDFHRVGGYNENNLAFNGVQLISSAVVTAPTDNVHKFIPSNGDSRPIDQESHSNVITVASSAVPTQVGILFITANQANSFAAYQVPLAYAKISLNFAMAYGRYLDITMVTTINNGLNAAWQSISDASDWIFNRSAQEGQLLWDLWDSLTNSESLLDVGNALWQFAKGHEKDLDVIYVVASVASFIDPTPLSDSIQVAIDLYRGDYTSAAINAACMLIPGGGSGGAGRAGSNGMDALANSSKKFMVEAEQAAGGGAAAISRHADDGLKYNGKCALGGGCFVTGTLIHLAADSFGGEPIDISAESPISEQPKEGDNWQLWLAPLFVIAGLLGESHLNRKSQRENPKRSRPRSRTAHAVLGFDLTEEGLTYRVIDEEQAYEEVNRRAEEHDDNVGDPTERKAVGADGINEEISLGDLTLVIPGRLSEIAVRTLANGQHQLAGHSVLPSATPCARCIAPTPMATQASRKRQLAGQIGLQASQTRTPIDTPSAMRPASPVALTGRWWRNVCLLLALCSLAASLFVPAGRSTVEPRAVAAIGSRSTRPIHSRVKPIEQVQLGERVAGRNPLREQVDDSFIPNQATWKHVQLHMVKQNGLSLWVELLRPAEWFEARRVRVGGVVDLDLPELGAEGSADVLAIGPCPPIEPGDGAIVTGRFTHETDGKNVVSLRLEGEPEATGVTTNHPYWSVDRHDFVAAGDLHLGETVETLAGLKQVASITPLPYAGLLNNLETTEHVYRVAGLGVLVHNTYGDVAGVTSAARVAPNKMQTVRQLGQEGENAAGIVKNTQRIDSLSGKAKYRIPDEITEKFVKEVKNVARLDLNSQIRDSLHHAIEQGKDFILVVRRDTQLSQSLKDAIRAGWIKLEYLP